MMADDLHPAVVALAPLLGTWEGPGSGDYPTIDPFRYIERVTFVHVGKPFLAYQQKTWHPETGAPMHAEVGYLRGVGPVTGDRTEGPINVELVLAHPTGVVEVEQGTFDVGVLRVASTTIGLSSTAKQVRALRREFRVDADQLSYDLWMAHADTPETHHLHADLARVV